MLYGFCLFFVSDSKANPYSHSLTSFIITKFTEAPVLRQLPPKPSLLAQIMFQIRFHSLIASALILGLLSGGASAALYTWDGGGNNNSNWGGATQAERNWNPNAAITATGSDQFVFGSTSNLSNTNNISDFTLTSLTFNNTAGAFILGGAFKLFFNAGAGIINEDIELQTINMALGLNVTTTVETRSGNVAIGGAISGAGGITKTGSNTLTLSVTNTYTGATLVNEGTLFVDGSILSSSLTTVASAATIGGSGTIGALTVSSGGFINPGTNNTGILSTGNYTQAGTYNTTITSTVAGTGHDQVNVAGTVNVTSGSLSTSFSGSYSANNLIFILLNDGTDAITGTYNGLAQNAIVTSYGGFNWQISYTADSVGGTFTGGNDIALKAIPEPSAVLLGGLGSVLLLLRRRRVDHTSER